MVPTWKVGILTETTFGSVATTGTNIFRGIVFGGLGEAFTFALAPRVTSGSRRFDRTAEVTRRTADFRTAAV